MSSHYFVKEGQEPALVILDGMPFSAAADLLAWAPLVVVADRALEVVISWGIKVDVVVTLGGEPVVSDLLELQQPLHIIAASDESHGISEVFRYLASQRNSAVAILASEPEKIMSTVTSINIGKGANLDITIQNGSVRWSRLAHNFHKWFPANTRFRLFSAAAAFPEVDGTVREGDDFVTVSDGIIQIPGNPGLWIGEYF
jgi:hypothetical protein